MVPQQASVSPEQTVGPRIRIARENAGLTQEQLARRIGVEMASLQSWEEGEKEPRANRLVMLCGVLDVSVKWLLEGMQDKHMMRGDDPLPVISAELDRLRHALGEAERLADTLSERIEKLRTRRKSQ